MRGFRYVSPIFRGKKIAEILDSRNCYFAQYYSAFPDATWTAKPCKAQSGDESWWILRLHRFFPMKKCYCYLMLRIPWPVVIRKDWFEEEFRSFAVTMRYGNRENSSDVGSPWDTLWVAANNPNLQRRRGGHWCVCRVVCWDIGWLDWNYQRLA